MFSIRNFKSDACCLFWAVTLSALGGGCSTANRTLSDLCGCGTPNVIKTPSPVAEEPPADEATELRGFRKSYAFYHSGATQAWPTRWYYSPNPDYTTVENYIADPVMAIVQTVTIPATVLVDYPFRKIYYDGDVVPASYTGMPPLPPEPMSSRTSPDPDPLSALQEPVFPPIQPLIVERPPLILPPPETKPAKAEVKLPKTAPSASRSSPTTRPIPQSSRAQ